MKKYWYAFLALMGRPGIVQFKDGSFAIRKGMFAYRYLDLVSTPSKDSRKWLWWTCKDKYMKDCKTKSLEEVATALATLQSNSQHDPGFPIALKFKD